MEMDPINMRGMLYVIVTNKLYLLKLLIFFYLVHSFWHSASELNYCKNLSFWHSDGELNYCKNFKLIDL